MLCRVIILTETDLVDASHALLCLIIIVEFVISYYCEPVCY